MLKALLLSLLLIASPALAAETVYSAVIEDLPLMQGMTEKADDAVVFDNPDGRIVETSAAASSTPAAVKKFYSAALPPLGWVEQTSGTYVRGRETLKVSIESREGHTVARFTLTPKP